MTLNLQHTKDIIQLCRHSQATSNKGVCKVDLIALWKLVKQNYNTYTALFALDWYEACFC